ncbi:MAG: flagellin [Candidatus Delongbacteria bacterium]|nr:flagellin [Candidatus Delongbacteria bacterium]
MRINTNVTALKAYNALFFNTKEMSLVQEKLASGYRINSASDDPAGFILARKLVVRADGLANAADNIGTARNLLGVAEGGANSISDLMEEIRKNVIRAADDSLTAEERIEIQSVVEELAQEIDQIVDTTRWGDQNLLDGRFQSKFFQTGPDYTDRTNFNIPVSFYASDLGIGGNGWETAQHGQLAGMSINAGSGVSSVEVYQENKSIAANGFYRIKTIHNAAQTGDNAKVYIEYDSNGFNVTGGTTWIKEISLEELNKQEQYANSSNGLTNNEYLIEGLKISFNLPDNTDPENPVFGTLQPNSETVFEVTGARTTMLDLSHHGNAIQTLQVVNDIMKKVNHMTANIGAKSQRLSLKEDSIAVTETNVRAAASRIEDADMAKEQLESSRLQILQQTGLSMMAQAMFLPQNLLSLFK